MFRARTSAALFLSQSARTLSNHSATTSKNIRSRGSRSTSCQSKSSLHSFAYWNASTTLQMAVKNTSTATVSRPSSQSCRAPPNTVVDAWCPTAVRPSMGTEFATT